MIEYKLFQSPIPNINFDGLKNLIPRQELQFEVTGYSSNTLDLNGKQTVNISPAITFNIALHSKYKIKEIYKNGLEQPMKAGVEYSYSQITGIITFLENEGIAISDDNFLILLQ